MSSTRPLSARGVAAHQVEREAVATPRHEAEEAAQGALGVARLDQDAVAVERVPEPPERHGEAALVAAVAAPLGGGVGSAAKLRRVQTPGAA